MPIHPTLRVSALTLAIFTLSCQSQGPLAPTPPRPVTVQFAGPSCAVFAQQGDYRVCAVDILILEKDRYPAIGVPVSLFVKRGPGELIPSQALTDRDGRARALFCAEAPQSDQVVVLGAVVFTDTTLISIKLPAGPAPSLEEVAPGNGEFLSRLLDRMIRQKMKLPGD
jgi:hypothetical protein